MAQEEKQLLLKDLCARLPYGVKVHIIDATGAEIDDKLTTSTISHLDRWIVKPYLRPMSSMTEEEQKEFVQFHCVKLCPIVLNDSLTVENESKMMDWLIAHHFDFRGLIKKGIALEVPEGMYKTE